MDEVAQLPAVLEDAGGAPARQGAGEDGRDARVGRVPRHPRAVDVVVAQGGDRHARLAGERRGEMLLLELRRGVDVAGIQGRVLRDGLGLERPAAPRAGRLEAPGLQVGDLPRARPHLAVLRARVAALAVDHHGRGLHEPPAEPAGGEGAQEDGGAQVVVGDVVGDVADVRPEADHRRLVADGVDPVERRVDVGALAHVAADERRARGEVVGQARVRGGMQVVQQPHVVPRREERLRDVAADEAGASRDQDEHPRHSRSTHLGSAP
ncbi:MAG: hypothetical protein AVDCRST_MAG13-2133 [uncultured Solirubrobacteraceae bacterium]|uniref:Uncharacterized protein n=1 Tax=uncultured Solirubrobacteraceae bacterium TaxID=1162706 RepID=A0A6J4SIK6_9ACTN|nr:MAG: hypothetical protein AVDCRST_MAG13-2133 [uncultured Solirubrobacteraceae bacterium]